MPLNHKTLSENNYNWDIQITSKSGKKIELFRTIHAARQPTQPGQPARIQSAATQSDNSSSQMWVPNSLTQPHASWLLIFRFKTHDTRPEPKPLSFPANYYKFRTKSEEILSRSVENWSRSFEIQQNLAVIWQNLGQISTDLAKSQQVRPYFGQI